MSVRATGRDIVAALLIAVVTAALASWPGLDIARGLSLDIVTATRWLAFGPRVPAQERPVVVVAIDEQTYQTAPFRGSPTTTWTREIGRVLTAILDGGAKVVGFDIVFPNSIEQSEIPFGDAPLGARLRGFDRDFLRALAAGASSGKVVLGEIGGRGDAISPSPGQRVAMRQQSNIRALNVYVDRDDVVRRLPLSFTTPAGPVASMAVELAARTRGVSPLFEGGAVDLGGQRVEGLVPNTLTLNFDGGADDFSTYSLADLHACLDQPDPDYFRRQFDGKVVLIGTLLDVEDRKLTSKRFATGVEGASHAPRCKLPPVASERQFKRRTIPGVYLHATAVDNLLSGEVLTEFGQWPTTAMAMAFTLLVVIAAALLSPIVAAGIWGLLTLGLLGLATAAMTHAVALPLGEPVIAGFAALMLMIGYRFVIVDRTERFLRASFGLYLAPQVIEQMLRSQKLPRLGGEMRDVTVLFSDVVGFSGIAERLAPAALVELMNEYLSEMTAIIEKHGGYVDKYIGDSIVAVFGAPVNDPHHARNTVRAALECRERLEHLNLTAPAFGGQQLRHRIGLNSGEALVGNIGSRKRFNYTVMSDAVNLASRLEGANKYFATEILASESTVAAAGKEFVWREIEAVRVKGRAQAVKIYQPLGPRGHVPAAQLSIAEHYAEGLAHWRARDFAAAAVSFAKIAHDDPTAALFLTRAGTYVQHPPPPDWEPVHALEGK